MKINSRKGTDHNDPKKKKKRGSHIESSKPTETAKVDPDIPQVLHNQTLFRHIKAEET